MARPRVAAVIQARMSSTRLPGKVLMPLAGKPVLWHIISRLRRCSTVNRIAIATSELPSDDALVAFARAEGVELVRGPEDNVLQRFALAAKQLDPDFLVRVTGDAPLIDPATLDQLVERLVAEQAEYCTGEKGISSINEGFCAFSRGALDRLLAEAPEDPVAIEHVTAYFKQHPDSFKIAEIPVPEAYRFSGARLSVDTPADLSFLEELYRRLAVAPGEAEVTEVVRLLRKSPELLQINGHIYQKKATDRTVKVLVRCDGDALCGLGHVVRSLAVADELREQHGCGISFAMASGAPGMALVREKGFPVAAKPDGVAEEDWLEGVMQRQRPDLLLLDVRSGLSREKVGDWRRNGIVIATVDDPSERRLEADLAFYPPVPQARGLDWSEFTGELYLGWEWVLLRKDFAATAAAGETAPGGDAPAQVLVTMGGSDPAGMTLVALRALDQVQSDLAVTVVVGAAFSHDAELAELIGALRHPVSLRRNVTEMAALMRGADVCIASFGVTAYELAAVGVPSILLCLSEDHASSASALSAAGIAVNLGLHQEVSAEDLAGSIRALLEDPERRRGISCEAKRLIDGRGAIRTAEILVEKVTSHYAPSTRPPLAATVSR
jgi:spore coat polysaccharide biosynthesis protein SpsF